MNKKVVVIAAIVTMSLTFLPGVVSFAEVNADTSIFEYKQELSLTDKQEKNLRNILTKLQNYNTEKQKDLDSLRAELSKLLVDKAALWRIKWILRRIAGIQADATFEDIASIRAIEKVLTVDQISKWRGIQEAFRKSLQDTQAAAANVEKKGE